MFRDALLWTFSQPCSLSLLLGSANSPVVAQLEVWVRGQLLDQPVKLQEGHTTARSVKEQLRALLLGWDAKFTDGGAPHAIQADELLVFNNDGGTLLGDNDDVQNIMSVTVCELFTTTPVPLYRTVSPDEAHPAVLSKHASPFSKVAPLFCAGFSSREAQRPSFFLDNGTVKVRGVSLRPTAPTVQSVQPHTPVDKDEAKGWSNFPLDQLPPSLAADDPFGKVHTSAIFSEPPRFNLKLNKVDRKKSPPKTAGRNDETTTRHIFLSFELPEQTNLSAFQFAVVFDKYEGEGDVEGNHFTLIPWPADGPFPSPPPNYFDLWGEDRGADPRLHNVYERVDTNTHPVAHPECIRLDQYNGYFFFPLVCQEFRAHNILWLRARGTPSEDDVAPDHPNRDQAVTLARAAAHLSSAAQPRSSDTIALVSALEQLVTADYNVHGLDPDLQGILRRALEHLPLAFKPEGDINDIKAAIDILGDAQPQKEIVTYASDKPNDHEYEEHEENEDGGEADNPAENATKSIDPDKIRRAFGLEPEDRRRFIEAANMPSEAALASSQEILLRRPQYQCLAPHLVAALSNNALVKATRSSMEVVLSGLEDNFDPVLEELRNREAQELLVAVANIHFDNRVPVTPLLIESRSIPAQVLHLAPEHTLQLFTSRGSARFDVRHVGRVTQSLSSFLQRKDNASWHSEKPPFVLNAVGRTSLRLRRVLSSDDELDGLVQEFEERPGLFRGVAMDAARMELTADGVSAIFVLSTWSTPARLEAPSYVIRFFRAAGVSLAIGPTINL